MTLPVGGVGVLRVCALQWMGRSLGLLLSSHQDLNPVSSFVLFVVERLGAPAVVAFWFMEHPAPGRASDGIRGSLAAQVAWEAKAFHAAIGGREERTLGDSLFPHRAVHTRPNREGWPLQRHVSRSA